MGLAAKIAIGLLTPIVAYFGYDSLMGHVLVHRLCAKDGGLKVYETTFAEGYLDESVGDELYCSACFERLGERQFEYIDVHVPGDPATAHPLAIRPGYYRYSLAPRGDARCELWKSNVNLDRWAQMRRSAGIADDQCVAVEALPGRPKGAVLTKRDSRYAGSDWPVIHLREIAIDDMRSRRQVARLRDYYFVGRWSELFNFGPSRPTARCEVPLTTYLRMTGAEPLRDTSKLNSPNENMESSK
jgi:hypothetical protein